MTEAEVIRWAVGIWRKLPHGQRTNQKWLDLVASCRSLMGTS